VIWLADRISRMPSLMISPPIPYACQFASPELVYEFIHKTRELLADPRWADYGAASPEEYAHWALRSCGVVCVKMAVEGLTGIFPRPVMAWVHEGLALDGYRTEIRHDRPVEIGWKHAALADLARQHGLSAELVSHLSLDALAAHLQSNRVIIASVTSELGEEAEITRHSGHLVVVIGAELSPSGQVEQIITHNPSGRTPDLRANALIPSARFTSGFSGRGIVIGK
jgi:peptidase C39-like protein